MAKLIYSALVDDGRERLEDAANGQSDEPRGPLEYEEPGTADAHLRLLTYST
jgi:hypothetical protein